MKKLILCLVVLLGLGVTTVCQGVDEQLAGAVEIVEAIPAGDFDVTYYCTCKRCCGKADGITYIGTTACPGYTVAVDPDVIPLGSSIYIEGIGLRVAEDVGGGVRGNKVDICVGSHEEALRKGRGHAKVYLVEEAR